MWKSARSFENIFYLILTVGYFGFISLNSIFMWYSEYRYLLYMGLVFVFGYFLLFYLGRFVLAGMLLLSAIISGVYGYVESGFTLVDALYATVNLFLLSFTKVPTDDYHLSLEIARWSAAGYTISTVISLLIQNVKIASKKYLYLFTRNYIVVLGYNDLSQKFIENIMKEHQSFIVMIDDPTLIEELKNMKIPFILETNVFQTKLGYHLLKNAQYIVIFEDDDIRNIELYIRVKERIEKANNIRIHLNQGRTIRLFEKLLNEKQDYHDTILFSTNQLIAMEMLQNHPLYIGHEQSLRQKNGRPLHFVFIGFGLGNQHLAYQILHLIHFITKEKSIFTIIDKEIDKIKYEADEIIKAASDLVEIDFIEGDIEYGPFTFTSQNPKVPVTHIYSSMQNDFLKVIEVIQTIQEFKGAAIFLQINQGINFTKWLSEWNTDMNISRYPMEEEVLNCKNILNETALQVAEKIHESYITFSFRDGSAQATNWKDLDSFKQMSNYYQLLHNDTKLMLMNLEKTRDAAEGLTHYETHIEEYIDELAACEHRRWMIYLQLRGWVHGEKKETSKQVHCDLVDWDKLDEESKKYNIDFIRNIEKFYQSQHIYLKKSEEESI